MRRLCINLILFFSVLLLPWWALCIVILAAAALFRGLYEIIIWVFVADLLYGTESTAWYGVPFAGTGIAAIAVFLIERVKNMTRFF